MSNKRRQSGNRQVAPEQGAQAAPESRIDPTFSVQVWAWAQNSARLEFSFWVPGIEYVVEHKQSGRLMRVGRMDRQGYYYIDLSVVYAFGDVVMAAETTAVAEAAH